MMRDRGQFVKVRSGLWGQETGKPWGMDIRRPWMCGFPSSGSHLLREMVSRLSVTVKRGKDMLGD